MEFTTEYLANEVQILLSTFILNNALFIAQKTGILSFEFTNINHIIFPWNLDTEGSQVILPQFGEKYPVQNYEVVMKTTIS